MTEDEGKANAKPSSLEGQWLLRDECWVQRGDAKFDNYLLKGPI